MADSQRSGLAERDIDQAITALKKGAYLLKYGRRGKPKFCPFQLSNAIFQRYPRPEKEYQSFSLMYNDRSLDLDPGQGDSQGSQVPVNSAPQNRLGKAFCDIISYTAVPKSPSQVDLTSPFSSLTAACVDNSNGRPSTTDTVRVSLSSAVSSSSQGSYHEDFDALGDVFFWEKVLEMEYWEVLGEGSGGRLGHGIEMDVPHPKLIDTLAGINIELVACGEHHTCAVTLSGDLYTWGDGAYNCGLLGHGSEASQWMPKKLFTFGDGTFGSLGHGDHNSTTIPREVEALRGLRTTRVACGVWHTVAVVEVRTESSSPKASSSSSSGKLFTWGDGDKGRLGHGDKESKLIPECVDALATGKVPTIVEGKIAGSFVEEIACGSYHVAVLTSKAEVYTWGKGSNGQLGHGDNEDRNTPTHVDFLKDKHVKSIACGSNFTAIICLHKWVSSTDHSVCSGCRNPFGFRRKRHNCYNCGLVFCKACSGRKSLKASLAPNMNKPHRVCDDCFNKLKKAADPGSVARLPKARAGNMNQKSNDAADRVALGPRLQAQLSRLSSSESVGQSESWHSRRDRLSDSDTSRIFPVLNGTWQLGAFIH
ncbi:hypothetical protein GH714_036157 [Hevea brasiliensis]|uniref:FYVE-type domain-containing protein n=1 Tax=Hevea brasiliensis TaxID=3981 RepID=A0A6A6LMX1_HEVBR|nr:hypothetical protein GH714_036157 [Hevea brasiliensis]